MPSYVTDANLSSTELAFCGATAGVISRVVIAPLDVVKIRMQLQTHRTHFSFNAPKKHQLTSKIKYSNTIQALKTILKEEGIRGLYKGNMPAEYLYLSYNAVEFWAYKELEQRIEKIDKEGRLLSHPLKTFSSGMIAGCMATTATYPFDLLRTRFAAATSVRGSGKDYTTVARAIVDIYEKEGIHGFYRGLWPAIIQIMPYMGLLFSSYDLFAKGFKKLRDEQVLSASYKPTHDMISGALSGLFSKTMVYPFDLVRKRMQMEGTIRKSWLTCIKTVVKQEGYRSLYKGLIPSLVKVGPANAVTFMVFEETKDILLWLKKK
ncbi:mitochondrial carrier domain-containing protein [Cokeromyces recurvatus]|uniref:mitochondrial carrier domain-containing protein n=1 Tax=Cokeromyces recurvatus TaxID=90255 RepID=UPI0022204AB3|nr:mitochondrial carrier domain-containing protein [Cokeromyces recurvatus]KAI7907929.1 mitochondrial carrier domain-containing protein [Cokeromyces recurvatus]